MVRGIYAMTKNSSLKIAKTILICGATGFIGRNLVNYWAGKPNVEVIAVWHVRQPFETPPCVRWVQCDLRKPDEVDALVKGCDIIIQAAAATSGSKDIIDKPHIHVTDNAVMNSYLLRAAYDNSINNFIFFSCSVMYPSSKHPVKETDFTGEIMPEYTGAGWTKVYIEKMCAFYASIGNTRHTVIRHSNIYGPYDKYDLEKSHVFGATITKAMLADKKVTIWGAGEEKRDLLHVQDLLNFIDLAIENQKNAFGLYNCGSGKSISVGDLAQKIITATGKDLSLEYDVSKPNIPFNLSLDSTKAGIELGWKAKITLEDGISDAIRWWQGNVKG